MEEREQVISENGFCEYYAEPFNHWIIDNYFEPCELEEIPSDVWSFWEAFYDNDIERGKRTSRSFDEMPPRIRTAFIKLRHIDTVKEWQQRMGNASLIDDPMAHGAGLHKSDNGSFLQVHLDYARHPEITSHERKLNLLLFLHPEWKAEWGGQLLLCDPTGKTVKAIDPLPGRLVAFEVSDLSYHGVRVIRGAKVPRLSCAVYYITMAHGNPTRRRAMFFPNRSNGGVPHECL